MKEADDTMYVLLEYITYLFLLLALGVLIFVASAAVLITEESAKLLAASTRKLAIQAGNLATKHFGSNDHQHSTPPENPH